MDVETVGDLDDGLQAQAPLPTLDLACSRRVIEVGPCAMWRRWRTTVPFDGVAEGAPRNPAISDAGGPPLAAASA
ncbi:hypothetical protein [Nocardia farcinica]|uniref:hypothetical protein n=1 Tax=Nocardia farcinica TaxID=37329 RepID=UPI002453AF24|nr:hypothetical protein [Nocardia farcinica]